MKEDRNELTDRAQDLSGFHLRREYNNAAETCSHIRAARNRQSNGHRCDGCVQLGSIFLVWYRPLRDSVALIIPVGIFTDSLAEWTERR